MLIRRTVHLGPVRQPSHDCQTITVANDSAAVVRRLGDRFFKRFSALSLSSRPESEQRGYNRITVHCVGIIALTVRLWTMNMNLIARLRKTSPCLVFISNVASYKKG